jgi:hypothetical protein
LLQLCVTRHCLVALSCRGLERAARLRHLPLGGRHPALRGHHGLLFGDDLLWPGAGLELVKGSLGGHCIGFSRGLGAFGCGQRRLGLLTLRPQQSGIEDH